LLTFGAMEIPRAKYIKLLAACVDDACEFV
jgi:hypothetical protein